MSAKILLGSVGANETTEGPDEAMVTSPHILTCYLPAVAKANIATSGTGFPVGGLPVGIAHTITAVYLVPSAAIPKDGTHILTFGLTRSDLDGIAGDQVATADTQTTSANTYDANVAASLDIGAADAFYDPDGVRGTMLLFGYTKSGTGQDFPQSALVVEYVLRNT